LEVSVSTRHLAGSRRNRRNVTDRRWFPSDGVAGPVDSSYRRKPNHLARAVDIAAIWPPISSGPVRDSYRLAAVAGARGVSAQPMSFERRFTNYCNQNALRGGKATARQARQLHRTQFLASRAEFQTT
jgi:hypothetical protein